MLILRNSTNIRNLIYKHTTSDCLTCYFWPLNLALVRRGGGAALDDAPLLGVFAFLEALLPELCVVVGTFLEEELPVAIGGFLGVPVERVLGGCIGAVSFF